MTTEIDGTDITSIELGDTYRDKVTGFEGKVGGRSDFITGCAQALLSALVHGKIESVWIDYPRLEFVRSAEDADISREPAVRRSGGPAPIAETSRPMPGA